MDFNKESNTEKKDNLIVSNRENYKKSLHRGLRFSKEDLIRTRKCYKREIATAKEQYNKAVFNAKEMLQTAKNKVLLSKVKLKNPSLAYENYIKTTLEHWGDRYNIIIEDDEVLK